MNEFFEYLNRLRPEQRKVIKAAWRVSLVGMEREFPKLLGWTRYHRIPRLISAGVYVTHPEFDEQHLIALIRGEVRESEFLNTLAHGLEHLGVVLQRWVKLLPADQGFNHRQLHKDLLSWQHPSAFVQNRWRREYYTRLDQPEPVQVLQS